MRPEPLATANADANRIALSVVIPAFNEGANVQAVVAEVRRELDANRWVGPYEVVLVNDGSRDDTGPIMDRLAASFANVTAIHHAANRGFGAALRTGFAKTRGERVTLVTGDGEIGVDQVLKLLQDMGDADLMVSRRERNVAAWREALSAGANLLIRIFLGISPQEVTGIYIVRGDVLRTLPLYSDTGLANLEVVIQCRRSRRAIRSGVIIVRPRLSGESKVTNLRTTLQTLWEMVKLRFKAGGA